MKLVFFGSLNIILEFCLFNESIQQKKYSRLFQSNINTAGFIQVLWYHLQLNYAPLNTTQLSLIIYGNQQKVKEYFHKPFNVDLTNI